MSTNYLVHLPDDLPVGSLVRIRVELLTDDVLVDHYQPRTEVGRLALKAGTVRPLQVTLNARIS